MCLCEWSVHIKKVENLAKMYGLSLLRTLRAVSHFSLQSYCTQNLST